MSTDDKFPKMPTFELKEDLPVVEKPEAKIEDLKPEIKEVVKPNKLNKVLLSALVLSLLALAVVTYLMLGFQKEFKAVSSRVSELTREFSVANQENKALEEKSLALEKELQVLRQVSQEKIALDKEIAPLKESHTKLEEKYKTLSENYKKLYDIYEKQKSQLSARKTKVPVKVKK